MTNSYLRIKLQITSVVCDPYDPDSFVTVGVKLFFAALRLAAGNTSGTAPANLNPAWYLVHRTKTASTL